MPTLYIRKVSPADHKDIKIQAAKECLSIQELVIKAIREYIRAKK